MNSHSTRDAKPSHPTMKTVLHNFVLLINLLWLLSPYVRVGAQGEQEARMLELGKPVERELAGGQNHSCQITLAAGKYLRVEIEQRGIDVVVRLAGPDGKQITQSDRDHRKQGLETVAHVVEMSGLYKIDVQAKQQRATAGRYEIRLMELRAATEKDRELQEAERLSAEVIRLYQAGKYAEARPLVDCALEFREKNQGPEHHSVATSLNDLANIHHALGDYAKAEPLYLRALTIREKSLGPEHFDVASSLNNLARLCQDKGDYAKAETFFRRALAIREKTLGPEDIYVARSLHNLAGVYYQKGDYTEAEPLYQRAIAITVKEMGPEHTDVGIALNNLASLYNAKGDNAKAEPLYRRTLAIWEKRLGPDHTYVATTLNNLANVLRSKGDYAQSEPLYQRALASREKTLGMDHPDLAYPLVNLAIIYRERGDYAKAEPLLQRALDISEKKLGPEHPNVAVSLNDLALLYQLKGDYVKAEPMHQRALAIRKNALGPEHPDVSSSLNNLAMLYDARGDIPQAVALQSSANKVSERNIAHNLATGSERQKLAYMAKLSGESDRTVSLHTHSAPNDLSARNLAVTTILQRKGRTLDAVTDTVAALRRRASPEDQAFLDQLKEANAQRARLVFGGPQKTTPAEHLRRIESLDEKVEQLEAEISRHSPVFAAQTQPVTLAAIKGHLPGDAALIEFFSYRPFNAKSTKPDDQFGQPRYVAYILSREGEIQWVDLGEAAAIDRAVVAWRKSLRDPRRMDASRLGRALDEKVMRPVRALLGETRRVLISPDGALNLIPFAALVDKQGRYLVERYSFSYLTSGRDLLRLKSRPTGNPEPVIVANPAFGERSGVTLAQRRNVELRPDPHPSVAQKTSLDRIYFPQLPATAGEAQALKSILPQAAVFTGEQATEPVIKRLSGPRVLHIATHGFFLEDIETKSANTRDVVLIRDGPAGSGGERLENPLLRSGLALTGANLRNSGPNQEDDGVLTAMEVAGLDLWGTKLVALSACDTGVGEVKNGEGVYGLRRALVLAGSETQVMSLWPVSDVGTRDLMIEYYKALQRGEGRAEALRQVQLRMLKRKDRAHPFYWASFIQSGEWANLDGKR
jgi:CHAT domain-containing protein/Tfp pilus assembly protein PilF